MARLWRTLLIRLPLCPLVALALAGGACSMPIGSLSGKEDDKADRTGSIAAAPVAVVPVTTGQAAADPPAETDLQIARATVSEVLGRGGKDTSAPWENPKTGARGTVTPVASAYSQDGFTCRDFLASYVRAGSEAWMQGEACRMHHGRWEVRSMKPWKRS